MNKKEKTLKNESNTNKHILQQYNANVKFQYEIIDLFENAKSATVPQLCHIIAEAKAEIGKAHIVAKLEDILYEKIYGLKGKRYYA